MSNSLSESKQLDSKQLYALAFIIMMSMKMFMVPALVIHDVGRDGYIPMAIFVGVETVALALSLAAIKFAQADIYTLFDTVYGKILTTVILLVISAYHILKITLVISEVKMFFLFSASEEFSWEIYIIPLLVFLLAVSVKTLSGIGRLAQLLLPIILLSVVVLFVLVVGKVDYTNILPVMEKGSGGVVTCLKKYPVWFGDLPMLAFCCGKVKKSKGMMWKALITAIVSALVVMFFATVIFLTYAYLYPIVDYGHNISNMVVYATGNYTYGRFDLVIFCVWMSSVFVQMAFMAYVTTRHLAHIFKAKKNLLPAIAVVVSLYITSITLFRSEVKLYAFCMGFPRYLTILNTLLLPLMALIASLVYRRKKIESNEKRGENNEGKEQEKINAPVFSPKERKNEA